MAGDESYLFGTGASADTARGVDWASTAVGPISSWPSSLRTTVATIFHARHPMFLWWGPELIQFYNDAYLPSFGVGKHPQAMGQPGRECWPEIWPLISPQIDDVMQRGVSSWNEDQLVPIARNDRIEEVYWTYGYSPVLDESGRVAGTLVICTETTPRVLAERRFGALRELAQALLASRHSADTLRLAAMALAHHPLDVPFALLLSSQDSPRRVGLDAEAAATLLTSLAEADLTKAPFVLPVAVVAGPWPEPVTSACVFEIDATTQVVLGLSTRLPLDERYQQFLAQIAQTIEATQARVRLEGERQNLLEQAPVAAAWMTGPRHVFEIANDLYCAMVGRDVRGKSYYDAFPELRETPLPGILDNVYRTGELFTTEEMQVALDRKGHGTVEEGFFKFNLAPVRDSDGRVSGMMVIALDITEQVTTRRELEIASRAKDEFLATMSHELRTPLNAMLGWARILRNDLTDMAKVQKGIAVIERNANAQISLISDLLDVSRIISGKMTLSLSSVDVAHAIAASFDVVRPSADAKQVVLESEVSPEVGAIVADPDRFQQVLWNLLSNAIRFTPPEGRVQITAARDQGWLRLAVSDTGQGIRAEHLPLIFERFRQVDASTTRSHGGLGLGLAIVRYLVEAHGGSVSVRSEGAGQGTTFDVRLPIRATRQPEVFRTEPRPTPSASPVEGRGSELSRVRVLAVDDHTDSLELLCDVLQAAGARVTSASSVAEALTHPGPFDIVISDIGMPDRDGYDLIRGVRERPEWRGVPAIALTAFARSEDADRARRAGFQEHLAKPVNADELISTIRRCIQQAAGS